MSPSQRPLPGKSDKTLLIKGLAVILRKSAPPKSPLKSKKKHRQKKEPDEDQRCKGCDEISDLEIGLEVFLDWTRENSESYWSPCLVQSIQSLEYKGYVRPTTLMVGGSDYCLEVVRSAWGRRMLRPPRGYDIIMLGDLDAVRMSAISQTQFAPLPEALCKAVSDLGAEGAAPSLPLIGRRLRAAFPGLAVPPDDVLYNTLGALIRERKLCHTGSGYSVLTPEAFRRQGSVVSSPRQMLLTNEEAIARLHGAAYAVDGARCTQTRQPQVDALTAWSSAERILEPRRSGLPLGKLKRCHSLKLLRGKDKEKLSRSNSFKSTGTSPYQNQNGKSEPESSSKKERSLFSRWFRRGRSEKSRSKGTKGTSSATQFPPNEWEDPDFAYFNSRATQTLERADSRAKGRSSSLNRMTSKDRHLHHMSSTPATPRLSHRSSTRSHVHPADPRSSSLTRKMSPRREMTTFSPVNGRPKSQITETRDQTERGPIYDSPFRPPVTKKREQSLLMANEKYGNVFSKPEYPQKEKVNPYQSTDIIKSHEQDLINRFSSFHLKKPEPYLGWRRPTSLLTTFNSPVIKQIPKQPTLHIVPHVPTETKESVVKQQLPQTTKQTIISDIKSSDTFTKSYPANGKEIKLGTTVDVEISVGTANASGNKSSLSPEQGKSELLKIATTWNQSFKSNQNKATDSGKAANGGPKVTTTTNITTSVTQRPCQENAGINKLKQPFLSQTVVDCGRRSPSKDTVCSSSPRSIVTDTKSEFFSDSPNTTTEVNLSKDDSGFSSSASTSRPMSASPC